MRKEKVSCDVSDAFRARGKKHHDIKFPTPAVAAALVSIIIMVFALMVPPVIGMADNGDFYRIANGQGIYKLDRYEDDQYFSYFSTDYGEYQYFNESENSILTTQVPLIQAAKAINDAFTGGKRFDIRFMSAILIAYCAIAIYLIVDFASYRVQGTAGYWIAALSVFIFADTGYTAYFNSFYAEGLVYVSFLCTIGCALLLTQRRYSPYILVAVIALNGLILTVAKQQNAPVGVLLGVLCMILVFVMKKPKMPEAERQEPYLKSFKRFRILAVSVAVLLCVSGIAVYYFIPQDFVNINQYHAMTRGVLMTSENPEETLEEFGMDRQFALLNKSIHFEKYPAIDVNNQMLTDNFYSKYSFVSVTSYYLRHPQKLLQMLDIAAKQAYDIRPESIGNFEKSVGASPGAKTMFFTLHSALKQAAAPKTVGFIIIWFILVVALCFKDRGKCAVVIFTILIGLSQIGVSIIGAGDADLAKHIFLYNVAFDLVNFLLGSAFIVMLYTRITRGWNNRKARTRQKKIIQNKVVT